MVSTPDRSLNGGVGGRCFCDPTRSRPHDFHRRLRDLTRPMPSDHRVRQMDDPAWATPERLHGFVNPTASTISVDEKAFGSHVLAHYYFTAPFRKTPLE